MRSTGIPVVNKLLFTDSHCHLTMADAAEDLRRAREENVRGFVVPATKLDDAADTVAVNSRFLVWSLPRLSPDSRRICAAAHRTHAGSLARRSHIFRFNMIICLARRASQCQQRLSWRRSGRRDEHSHGGGKISIVAVSGDGARGVFGDGHVNSFSGNTRVKISSTCRS